MQTHHHNHTSHQYYDENIRGVAVLSFSHVELEKSQAHSPSKTKTTLGTLNVFYFSHYQLFILQLNDWKYALLPNLMVTGTKRPDKQGYIYTLPHEHGFHHLKIDSMALDSAVKNFETVLLKSADFYYVTNGIKYKPSPNPIQRCFISGNQPRIQNRYASNMTDQNNNINELGFERKRDKFKRKLKNIADKFSRKTKVEESENLNMTQIRSFESIKGTTKAMAPVIRFHKQDIEQTIINANSIVRSIHPGSCKNAQFNEGISCDNRHPVIMVPQDHRDHNKIQIKTTTPIGDFKAAVNARADEIAERIATMQMSNNDLLQTRETLLKKDLSVISEKSEENTFSEAGNGSTKDEREITSIPSIPSNSDSLSTRLLSHQSTGDSYSQAPENVLQSLNKSASVPGTRVVDFCPNGSYNHSMDEGYKNITIESLPITLKHSEG